MCALDGRLLECGLKLGHLCLFRRAIRFEGTTLKPIELIAFADFGAFLDQAPF
jgi:hypothetical protein